MKASSYVMRPPLCRLGDAEENGGVGLPTLAAIPQKYYMAAQNSFLCPANGSSTIGEVYTVE